MTDNEFVVAIPINCKHKEWMGEPAGYTPVNWRCVDCGIRITAGEFLNYQMTTIKLTANAEIANLKGERIGAKATISQLNQMLGWKEEENAKLKAREEWIWENCRVVFYAGTGKENVYLEMTDRKEIESRMPEEIKP